MANPDRTSIHSSSPSREAEQAREFSHREPTAEEIAAEAYWIYIAKGARHGHDVEDWLEAERRLRPERSGQAPRRDDASTQQTRSHVRQERAET